MKSALHAISEQSGATFADFAGFSLPAKFAGKSSEYQAATTGTALSQSVFWMLSDAAQ